MNLKPFVLTLTIFTIPLSVARGDESVVYSDSFSGLDGFYSTNTSGDYSDSYEDRILDAHTFLGGEITGGDLVLTVREDKKSKGCDDKPGVLAFSFDEVCESVGHSGFIYQGRQDDSMTIPISGIANVETLKKIRVSFQYKATNDVKDHVGMTLSCRVEVNVDDPYDSRIELGELEFSGEWKTFQMTLDQGENKDAFLNTINATADPSFKLVWSQYGEITGYQDSDTLLIDDLRIHVLK